MDIRNLHLSWQQCPSQWKQAVFMPTFKKENKATFSNYRPLSLLNNFSALVEFAYMITCHIILNTN
jgi:hypothetical protein